MVLAMVPGGLARYPLLEKIARTVKKRVHVALLISLEHSAGLASHNSSGFEECGRPQRKWFVQVYSAIATVSKNDWLTLIYTDLPD